MDYVVVHYKKKSGHKSNDNFLQGECSKCAMLEEALEYHCPTEI
jgi:hypothetical protein